MDGFPTAAWVEGSPVNPFYSRVCVSGIGKDWIVAAQDAQLTSVLHKTSRESRTLDGAL